MSVYWLTSRSCVRLFVRRVGTHGHARRHLSRTRARALQLLRLHTFSDEELASSFHSLKAHSSDEKIDLASGIRRLAQDRRDLIANEKELDKIQTYLSSPPSFFPLPTRVRKDANVITQLSFEEYRTNMRQLGERLDSRVFNVGLSFLLAGGSVGMMIPAMPMLVAQLQIPSSLFGLVVGSFALSKLIGNIPSGYLVEKYGRKPLMIAGLGICGAGISAIGLSLLPSFGTPWLISCRFVSGLGVSAFVAGGFMFMADISTALNRTRTIAPVMAGFSAGAALGPAVGGVLLEHIGIANTYLAVGSIFLALSACNQLLLTETKPGLHTDDSLGATKQSGQEPRQLLNTGEGQKEKKTLSSLSSSFGDAFRSWYELLLQSPALRSITLLNGAYWFAYSGTQMTLLPLHMVSPAFQLNAYEIGGCFALMSCVSFMASQPSAILADKFSKDTSILAGSVLISTSMLCLPMATTLQELMLLTVPMSLGATAMNATPAALVGDLTEGHSAKKLGDQKDNSNQLTSTNSDSADNNNNSGEINNNYEKKKEVKTARADTEVSSKNSEDSDACRAQALSLLRTMGDVGFLLGAASSGMLAQVSSVPTAMQINGVVMAISAMAFAAYRYSRGTQSQSQSQRPPSPTER